MKVVDAHQHFWNYEPVKHSWISDDMKVIQRDFLPQNLLPIYEENHVDQCVAVQADQTEAETDFLLSLAEKYAFIGGVVGWVDLKSNDLEKRLEHYSQFDKLKGFRHVVQDEPDPNFMLGSDFQKGISLLHRYNFTYDILIFHHQLPATVELARAFPNMKFVLDHIAKPDIKLGSVDDWAKHIKALGECQNVYCKVSGMVTEADWEFWKTEDLIPYLDIVFENFGTDRIMFGSDWPVCLLAADYKMMKSVLDTYISGFSKLEKNKVMGENAGSFYSLKD
ncbi:MAG: amidohydrolase family protein [Cyclobacteriaceae bacterium]